MHVLKRARAAKVEEKNTNLALVVKGGKGMAAAFLVLCLSPSTTNIWQLFGNLVIL